MKARPEVGWTARRRCPDDVWWDRSGHRHDDRVPAGRAVGERGRSLFRLGLAGRVRRADFERVRARTGVPLVDPLPPGIHGIDLRQPGLAPGAAIDADLDALDAAVLRPGDAGDGDLAGVDAGEGLRCIDPRHRLDRRLLGPAALDPVRVV